MRALLACLLLCVACNTHVYSPPTGTFPLEGPATVGAQRRSVGADLSYEGAVFGPELFTGRLTYRHGLTDQMEVSAAPSVIFIPGSRAGDSHGGIYAGRAAFKYAPIRHLSGSVGFGGGGSAAGVFLSPDIGVLAGWDNRFLIPYGSARMFFSAPLAARTVHFTIDDGSGSGVDDRDSAPDHIRRTPHFTYGFQLSLGLRAPLYYNQVQRLRPALNCAAGVTLLYDRSPKNQGFFAGACGFELGF